jgi:6-pyruvoyltetrahydropterin/6-carboxytetrahydropterin synthase
MVSITKIFKFEAAHYLPSYVGKCHNIHGHSYCLEIEVSSPIVTEGSGQGMIMDFGLLKEIVERDVISFCDHEHLNSIFSNPTAENMVFWVKERLLDSLPGLVRVRLWETDTCYAEWKSKQ